MKTQNNFKSTYLFLYAFIITHWLYMLSAQGMNQCPGDIRKKKSDQQIKKKPDQSDQIKRCISILLSPSPTKWEYKHLIPESFKV